MESDCGPLVEILTGKASTSADTPRSLMRWQMLLKREGNIYAHWLAMFTLSHDLGIRIYENTRLSVCWFTIFKNYFSFFLNKKIRLFKYFLNLFLKIIFLKIVL